MSKARIVLTPDNWAESVEAAARVLTEGGIAVLPAEGVYGLHALASDERALARLRTLKPRDTVKSYIGLLARPEEAGDWAVMKPEAQALVRAHWPGALTLVLPAGPRVPAPLRAKDGTVALRCPGNPFLRDVVGRCRGLVLSTSANAPGEPPATRAEGPLSDRADLVVDQGVLDGTPSTVIRVERGRLVLLRAGAVSIEGSGEGSSEGSGS